MIVLMGDAELDEGNIYECMIEAYKHDVRNCWWIVDINRQSLDATTADRMFDRFDDIFETCGWRVLTLKHGKVSKKRKSDRVASTSRRGLTSARMRISLPSPIRVASHGANDWSATSAKRVGFQSCARTMTSGTRPADADRNSLRPVYRARPRCAQLRLLHGRALLACRYAHRFDIGPVFCLILWCLARALRLS